MNIRGRPSLNRRDRSPARLRALFVLSDELVQVSNRSQRKVSASISRYVLVHDVESMDGTPCAPSRRIVVVSEQVQARRMITLSTSLMTVLLPSRCGDGRREGSRRSWVRKNVELQPSASCMPALLAHEVAKRCRRGLAELHRSGAVRLPRAGRQYRHRRATGTGRERAAERATRDGPDLVGTVVRKVVQRRAGGCPAMGLATTSKSSSLPLIVDRPRGEK